MYKSYVPVFFGSFHSSIIIGCMIVYHIGIVVFMIYQVIELCLLLFNHDIQIQKIDPVEIHVHLQNELIANEQLSDYQTLLITYTYS